MSALSLRAPERSRCVDPACRHTDGYRWTVCPKCKTSIFDSRFTHPDMHTTYARLKQPNRSGSAA